MKREIKKFRNLEVKGKIKSWWQDKIKTIRKTAKPQAKRLQRLTKKFGSLGIVILAAGITLASFFLPKNQLQILKEKLVKSPYDLEAHLELAKIFLGANQFEKAEKELKFLQFNSQSEIRNSVIEVLWQQKHYSDPKDIKKLISGWEEVLEKYPDYRDGYLQLAYLYYKLDKNKQAKENLKKALALDPNWEKTKELKEIIFEDLLDKEFLE